MDWSRYKLSYSNNDEVEWISLWRNDFTYTAKNHPTTNPHCTQFRSDMYPEKNHIITPILTRYFKKTDLPFEDAVFLVAAQLNINPKNICTLTFSRAKPPRNHILYAIYAENEASALASDISGISL